MSQDNITKSIGKFMLMLLTAVFFALLISSADSLPKRLTDPVVVNGIQLEGCPLYIFTIFSDAIRYEKMRCDNKNAARLAFGDMDAKQKKAKKDESTSILDEKKSSE